MSLTVTKPAKATSLFTAATRLKHETPFLLTDLSDVRDKVALFTDLLPDVAIYYAVKANRDEKIIRSIDSSIAGYDIASLGELELLLGQGVDASRIMYSNPVKIPAHIEQSYKAGVRHFAFDSLAEIEKLATYAPGSDVYVRVKVSDYGSKFPLSKKFGVDPMHALDYCSMAKDAGLHVKGVTFHVGSQSENVQTWEKAISISGKLIADLKKRDIDIEFLDLGGGFPADYGDPTLTITDVAQTINESVTRHIPSHIKLLAEPGRFMVANSSIMAATVIGREHRSGVDWLYLDVGTFQGLIEPLEMPEWKYPIMTSKDPKGYMKDFVLTGPTCDAYDTIGTEYLLPSDINVGDRVYIGATGAYTLVYATEFNGFKVPRVFYVGK